MSFNKKNVRYFNSISIVDDGKNVIKKYIGFDEYYKDKFLDEIIWMIKAQIKFSKNIPKIIDYSLNREEQQEQVEDVKVDLSVPPVKDEIFMTNSSISSTTSLDDDEDLPF